jgi:AcrR family transcriptional regulator
MSRERSRPLYGSTPPPEPTDGRRARGMRSRAAILERSVQMASRDGLEGLTMGELAGALDVPKSSVFALFGSKQELQLATLAAAKEMLIKHVVLPAIGAAPGARRLGALGTAWCDYLLADVFVGGCFLCAASAEMDGRPGTVRDAVAVGMREWVALLESNIEAAIANGEFAQSVDARAMAFRLNALGMAANWQRQLLDDSDGVRHTRLAWQAELERARRRQAKQRNGG